MYIAPVRSALNGAGPRREKIPRAHALGKLARVGRRAVRTCPQPPERFHRRREREGRARGAPGAMSAAENARAAIATRAESPAHRPRAPPARQVREMRTLHNIPRRQGRPGGAPPRDMLGKAGSPQAHPRVGGGVAGETNKKCTTGGAHSGPHRPPGGSRGVTWWNAGTYSCSGAPAGRGMAIWEQDGPDPAPAMSHWWPTAKRERKWPPCSSSRQPAGPLLSLTWMSWPASSVGALGRPLAAQLGGMTRQLD